MYIGLTRLLENSAVTANYDLEGRLCGRFQDLNCRDDKKIREAMANVKDNKDKVEDPQEKNKRLKKEKMCKKHLSKAEKKACLKAKKADNNKKAGNNKDAGLLAPAITISPDFFASVAASFGPPTSVTASFGLPTSVTTFSGPLTPAFVTPSPIIAISTSIFVHSLLFSFLVWPSLFFFPARYTTLTSLSPMQVFRYISLPLKDDYSIQCLISLLEISKKQLQLDIDEKNKKKLQDQLIVATKIEKTIRFLFSCYSYIPAFKLNIEWQMAFLDVKTNMDIIDRIALFSALYWVENFKSCNKHFRFLVRHIGLVTKKILLNEFLSQMNNV